MMDARYLAKTPVFSKNPLPKRFAIGLKKPLGVASRPIAPLLELAGRSWVFEPDDFHSLKDLHKLDYEEAVSAFMSFEDDLAETIAPRIAESLGFYWGNIHMDYGRDNEPFLAVWLHSNGHDSTLSLTDDILPFDELMSHELGKAALSVWLHDFCSTSKASAILDDPFYNLFHNIGIDYSETLTPDEVLALYRSKTEEEREQWDEECATFLMEIGIDGVVSRAGKGYRYEPLATFEGFALNWKQAIENAKRIDELQDDNPQQSIERFLSLWRDGAKVENASARMQKFLERTARFARSGLCGNLTEMRDELIPNISPLWQLSDTDGRMPVITTLVEEVGIEFHRNCAYEAGEELSYAFEPEKITREALAHALKFLLMPDTLDD